MEIFKRKSQPADYDVQKYQDEQRILSNIQRGTQIGEFVVVCRTDYVQPFSDPWVARFDYQWTEYLLLIKDLLAKPDDLSKLIFLPQDLSEVYYVVVPPISPNHSHLSPHGRAEYELHPGYERAVDAALQRDYATLPKRSVFHTVDHPQGSSWDLVVDDVLTGRKESVVVEYNGSRYDYNAPRDKKEAEASFFSAFATRRGAYPMEESLVEDGKYDIIPSVPNGVTARVTVREFVADPKQKAPFGRVSFQRTELPQGGKYPPQQPMVMTNVSFGNDLGPNDSLIQYLQIKYVQLEVNDPTVRIVGYF